MKRLVSAAALFSLTLLNASAAEPARPSLASGARPFAVVSLVNPRSIAVDAAGVLYVGDADTGTIHRLSTRGEASSVGGTGGAQSIRTPLGLAVERNGAVLVTDTDQNRVCRLATDGTLSELGRAAGGAADFTSPIGVVVDANGDIFVADNGGAAIRKIARDGTLTTFAGQPGATGHADGPGAAARFTAPRGIAIDRAGNLYVADEGNHNIRKISPAGVVSTLAGEAGASGAVDGTGTKARFGAPRGLTVDTAGNVYVADTDNHVIRKITPTGVVSTLAGQAGDAGSADGRGGAARFSEPRGVAADAAGNLFVADTGNACVRQITPDGIVTMIAGTGRR